MTAVEPRDLTQGTILFTSPLVQTDALLENSVPLPAILPREHGSILCQPEWPRIFQRLRSNSARQSAASIDIQGMPLQRLREWSRFVLLDQAVRYTSSLLNENVRCGSADVLVVTGHQPDFFHAGVWAKNFAASGLARGFQGSSLNLIIDNDMLVSTRLRVPVGPQSAPQIQQIPFDTDRPAEPWEESKILNRPLFQEFGSRVAGRMRENWSVNPLLEQGWSAAVQQASVSHRLCDVLAAVRVAIERQHDLTNLELPMSRLCETAPFRWFVAHLMSNLTRFHGLYNATLHHYRHLHGLRNGRHPVPDLEIREDWYEIPFWIWRSGDLQRARPFMRRVGSTLELRCHQEIIARWTQTATGSAEATLEALEEISRRAIRFRTRALTTTLFSRLCLADVFIHGIGGAKYDSMTDWLYEQFFDVAAPPFATVSATFHLPLGVSPVEENSDEKQLRHQLRDIRYNPDRHQTSTLKASEADLVSEKQQLIASLGRRRPNSTETRRIEQINGMLAASTAELENHLKTMWKAKQLRRAADSIRRDREFGWCLYSPNDLIPTLQSAFAPIAEEVHAG
jgi:hypothetical protein